MLSPNFPDYFCRASVTQDNRLFAVALTQFHINTTWLFFYIFGVVLLKSLGDIKIHKISANNLNVRERTQDFFFFPLNCQLISYCQEELNINFGKSFHGYTKCYGWPVLYMAYYYLLWLRTIKEDRVCQAARNVIICLRHLKNCVYNEVKIALDLPVYVFTTDFVDAYEQAFNS